MKIYSLLFCYLTMAVFISLSASYCSINPFDPPPRFRDTNDSLDIVAGRLHTCMLYNGYVRCWGSPATNGYGSNIGRFLPISTDSAPLEFADKEELVTQITAGILHTCVLFEDGKARCWGQNGNGELGAGSMAAQPEASMATDVLIPEDIMIPQISAGNEHTCAIGINAGNDRNIYCWGAGTFGKLGNNAATSIGDVSEMMIPSVAAAPATAEAPSLNELPVDSVPSKVAAGANHTCVLYQESADSDSIVGLFCWGHRAHFGANQVAAGAGVMDTYTLNFRHPDLINLGFPGGTRIIDIEANSGVTCIIADTGRVYCWGVGFAGQLGYGCAAREAQSGLRIHGVGNVAATETLDPALSINDPFFGMDGILTAATDSDNRCRNADDVVSYQNYTDIKQVVIGPGSTHSCVLHENGSMHCFGNNFGIEPTTVDMAPPDVSVGDTVGCDRTGMGVKYLGGSPLGYGINAINNDGSQQFTVPLRSEAVPVGGNVQRIGAGEAHTCAILSDENVVCWGVNCEHQLGYGPILSDFSATGWADKSPNSYGPLPFPFPEFR